MSYTLKEIERRMRQSKTVEEVRHWQILRLQLLKDQETNNG